jgi:predicted Zn-dependent peptidase
MLPIPLALLLTFQGPSLPKAPGPEALEEAVVEHRLENGWTFLILPREGPPIVSFETLVDVGVSDEPAGLGGIVHMFEHMAFKGSDRIGTLDWPSEEAALREVDRLYAELSKARTRDDIADHSALELAWAKAIESANALIRREEFSKLIERAGGAGSLNAVTSADDCRFVVSLPSNQIELWCWLESERFQRPILREFYLERDAVLEERNMRVDSNPFGTVLEELAASAFRVHPYGRPVIGSRGDIERYDRERARAFFEAKWAPAHCTTAIVGDVDPEALIPMLERYFGRISARETERPEVSAEPEQRGERRNLVEFPAQPLLAIGWLVPKASHPDSPAVEVAMRLLGAARSSRLERRLIREDPQCARVFVDSGWPGERHSNLAFILAEPLEGADLTKVEAAILEEVQTLTTEGPDSDELEGVLRVARIEHLRSLRHSHMLAEGLMSAQASLGSWRAHFHRIARLEGVTSADVQRVLRERFVQTKSNVVLLRAKDEPAGEGEEEEK